jgi:hypothetical protein
MTAPAGIIRDQVRQLIESQILLFVQRAPLTSSQLHEHHCRSEEIRILCQELDRIGTKDVIERLRVAS